MEEGIDVQSHRVESQSESQQLVEKVLSPKYEEDNFGFTRKIYEYDRVSFSFRGREELPIYPTLSESDTIVLGEAPRLTHDEEYQEYLRATGDKTIQPEATRHYSVTKTLQGVVELATALGSTDERLPKIKEDIQHQVYGQESLELIDQLVACNYLKGEEVENIPDIDAESIAVLSLLGNEEAQKFVKQQQEKLEDIDQKKEKPTPLECAPPREIFSESDFICVHATGYKPEQDASGNYIVRTTHDALNGITIRNTIHTTLNHRVVAHNFGDWSQKSYVILAPFQDMVKANDLPERFVPVDTWWTRNPGEPLMFPEATLVSAVGDTGDLLLLEGNGTVGIKSDGFRRKDLLKLYDFIEKEGEREYFLVSLNSAMEEYVQSFWNSNYRKKYSEEGLDSVVTILGKRFANREWKLDDLQRNLFSFVFGGSRKTDGSFENCAWEMVNYSNVPKSMENTDPKLREELFQDLIDGLTGTLKSWFYGQLNEYAVRKTIRKKGFKVASGSGNESNIDEQAHYLAPIMGVWCGSHMTSDQGQLEGKFRNAVNDAQSEDSEEFAWEKFDSDTVESHFPYHGDHQGLILGLNKKTRRVVYASGLLNSRVSMGNKSGEFVEDDYFLK